MAAEEAGTVTTAWLVGEEWGEDTYIVELYATKELAIQAANQLSDRF